jgi:hypothetical protein
MKPSQWIERECLVALADVKQHQQQNNEERQFDPDGAAAAVIAIMRFLDHEHQNRSRQIYFTEALKLIQPWPGGGDVKVINHFLEKAGVKRRVYMGESVDLVLRELTQEAEDLGILSPP